MIPIVILVRPQLGENIGAAARAMSNFGLTELRLVAPRDGWPNQRARETASGGEAVIDATVAYPDFTSALTDIQLSYAATARPRDMEKRVLTPKEAMGEIITHLPPPQVGREFLKIALVFGPERTGLENEEIVMCDTIITIPTAPKNSSLNLAQSLVVLGYEWFQASQEKNPMQSAVLSTPAPGADWQEMFAQLEGYLDATNYFRVAHKKSLMWQNLRNMLRRGQWNAQELRTFRGMLRSLWEKRAGNVPR